ncbi:stage VI sporulation protein F [Bacillus sp. REN10]|uniref:stage VI sporulation protein F n=1 Tax=Bacillus sp. REN10 TaxID=2782541 RepID=UPI00193AFBD1|nr:stage VI sporulation protein F [Bacillus sp. REN10]
MDNGLFKNIEKKTGVNMRDVIELANSLQHANFKDEKTVRGVIQKVSRLANKSVPKELENQIVQTIIKDGSKLDIQTITDMINKKRG